MSGRGMSGREEELSEDVQRLIRRQPLNNLCLGGKQPLVECGLLSRTHSGDRSPAEGEREVCQAVSI